MADASTFGGGVVDGGTQFGATFDDGGAGAGAGDGATMPVPAPTAPPQAPASQPSGFGTGLSFGPHYDAPDPAASPLEQTADTLQQRINRANQVATNPMLQFFNPEGVQAARNFVPAATEQLLKIRQQQSTIAAGKQQAATLGLAPGEVSDEASTADRVEVAKARALQGDLKVFTGLQAVDPKAAESIQDQVHEAAAGHLQKAQYAFDKLSNMRNPGEYTAAVQALQDEGALSDLQAVGVKVPANFSDFNASKAREGQALREARIGMDTLRQKLEDRNTYQPMEDKEAKTYDGRMTTVYGDQITNGTWSRNAAAGTRGLVVNGAADPRDLGKTFTLATPDQRKAIKEEFDGAVPKEDVEKYRAFGRTYQMATSDAKGNALPDGKINTNPNVQQGVAEGLASMLRGGSGGANVGLLKIELAKRGWSQGAIDGLVSNYAGTMNTLFGNADKPYLSGTTQKQIRDVMDVLKTYNDKNVGDRVSQIAQRAGALGLDAGALGFGKGETAGAIDDALKAGRDAQVARMLPQHQAIGGGDGVFQLGAQRPGAGSTALPPGTAPTVQQPGARPIATPVQQANQPSTPPAPTAGPGGPVPGNGGNPPGGLTAPAPTGGPGSPGGAPTTIAGQSINVSLPAGASPQYVQALQRIESGNEKSPWTAGAKGSSASGAFQLTNGTWAENKPAGAPNRAADATPAQQADALANLTQKNASALTTAGLPVNDASLYIAHNVGADGARKLLTAAPNADARTVVGDAAASNNPLFYKGRPTVAQVLQRYQDEMNKTPNDDGGPKPKPGAGGATAEAPGFFTKLSRMLSQGIPGGDAAKDKAVADAGKAAVNAAPAALSTGGAVAGGAVAGPAGAVAGGAAGGGAGQALKDYLQGNAQSPAKMAEQAALGGVLGVASETRPLLAAAGRVVGSGAVEGGTALAQGADAEDATEAGLKGAGAGLAGEAFGRSLGMIGHKVWSLFSPEAKTSVQNAAKAYSDAQEVLKTEQPKIQSAGTTSTVNGQTSVGSVPNPKYVAAENAKAQAEQTLKDAGLNPEEAAYAHKVSSEGVSTREAQAMKPAAVEKQNIGAGYQQLENEIGQNGVGAVKPNQPVPDGPLSLVAAGKVSKTHQELAERTEAAIRAPAANWQEKWVQLKEARSDLLTAERDAEASTVPGKTKIANDMRALGDSVRLQQEKAAKYVFGEQDGAEFMQRLKVLDVRYRNLMDATGGMDFQKVASTMSKNTEASRAMDRKFKAAFYDDPDALKAWDSLRKYRDPEATVPWTVAAEGLPVVGHGIKAVKLLGMMTNALREKAAGNPVRFRDVVRAAGHDVGGALATAAAGAGRGSVQRGSLMQ